MTIAALCALPTFAHAQTITTGALGGTVRDSAGLLLSDVTVTLTGNEGGAIRLVSTGMDGQFRFALVLPGTYTVLVERLGYRPKMIEQVPVRPGSDLQFDVRVVPARPPVDAPERVPFGKGASATSPGLSDWLSVLSFERPPWARREASELAGLSTKSTEFLETEGLPRSLSTVKVDGLPYVAARHSGFEGAPNSEIALPMNVLQSAELVTADPDAEWTGFAGGALAINTKRGAPDFTLETFGSWSGSGLYKSKFINDGNLSNSSMWGGLLMSGPVIRDTAHFVIGLEARKLDTPLPQAWQRDAALDAALLQVADSAFGLDLQRFTQPYVLQSNVVSGFGRFDWQVSNDNAFSFRAGFGNVSRAQGPSDVAAAVLPQLIGNGHDVFLSASLQSKIAGKFPHEIRAGFVTSNRDYTDVATDGNGGAVSTLVLPGSLRFGSDPRLPGSFKRTEVNLDQSLQFGLSTHQLKAGIDASAIWHDNSYLGGSAGSFIFGGASQFALSSGEFVQTSLSSSADTKFTLAKYGAFLQDRWSAAPGLRLTLGLRYDIATLPLSDVALNEAWQTATGIANNALPSKIKSLSPRLGLTYDGGISREWFVTASAGRYIGELDPGIVADVLLGDGDLRATRAFGNLGGFPTPVASSLPASLPELALLGPKFQAPQTDRFAFGVSRTLRATTLQLSAAYRFTDFLARRSDLNLFSDATAHDQYGRPLYGTLIQSGELVAVAQPNRRFSNFDRVTAISADGWSRYWGVTAGIQHDVAKAVGLFANYTHSRTRDTWPVDRGSDVQSQVLPIINSGAADSTEATSAFDLPDRVAAGIELRPGGPMDPRVSVIYRFHSGYPFTPAYPAGVDANGDGSDSNDAAFVDDNVTGAGQVIQSWPCLRSQVGHVAERNSCRQPNVHSLDMRFGLTVAHSARTSAELFVDGINLIESNLGLPDRALYTIDSTRSITTDPNTATVNIPFVVNPHFGEPLVRYGAGRQFRVGLQVNY